MSACPICNGHLRVFVEIPDQPVHCHVPSPDAETARSVPRGDIHLGYCAACGHVANTAFDATRIDYGRGYDNALHFSPRFRAHAETLAAHLVDRLDLHGRAVVEIGCGDGMFLRELITQGVATGYGFDPGLAGPTVDGAMTLTNEDAWDRIPAEAMVCRHVLEHLADPAALLRRMHEALKPGGRVYAEVPNGAFTWRDLGIWDIIYEHASYFSASSLHRLFADQGFAIQDVCEDFGGQFLGIETIAGATNARPAPNPPPSEWIDAFATHHRDKVKAWRDQLAKMRTTGLRALIWGAGSKAVSFLNLLTDPGTDSPILGVVDVNPRKQGTFIAGTGHPIIAPATLAGLAPEIVIVMNANYRDEIARQLTTLLPLGDRSSSWRLIEV